MQLILTFPGFIVLFLDVLWLYSAMECKQKGKRNLWGDEETSFFLNLLKEKKILNILDGKKFRSSEVFKTLENEMSMEGFERDSAQLKIKFKNLKREYLKTKRHNLLSGVDPKTCPFIDELEELLGDRPATSLVGFDSSQNEGEMISDVRKEEADLVIDVSEDGSLTSFSGLSALSPAEDITNIDTTSSDTQALDVQSLPIALPLGVPSGSNISQRKLRSSSPGKTKETTPVSFRRTSTSTVLSDVKTSIESALKKLDMQEEKENEFLDKLLKSQENLLKQCTEQFLEGLKSCFSSQGKCKSKKSKRQEISDSDSSSDEGVTIKKKKI